MAKNTTQQLVSIASSLKPTTSMRQPRKRPLLSSTNTQNAPAPKTATTRMLCRILDGETKPKKRKSTSHKSLAPARPERKTTTPSMLGIGDLTSLHQQKPKVDSLAFRGGLASVPGNHKRQRQSQTIRPKVGRGSSGLVREFSKETTEACSSQLIRSNQAPASKMHQTTPSQESPVTTTQIRPTINANGISDSSRVIPRRPLQSSPTDITQKFTPVEPAALSKKENVSTTSQPLENASRRIGLKVGKSKKPQRRISTSLQSLPTTNITKELPTLPIAKDQASKSLTSLPSPPPAKTSTVSSALSTKEYFQPSITSTSTIKPTKFTLDTDNTDILKPKSSNLTKSRSRAPNNDNFVRLNLKNSAGACRGARNKKSFRRNSKFANRFERPEWKNNDQDNSDENGRSGGMDTSRGGSQPQSYTSRMTGLDPLDDYQDGFYGSTSNKRKKSTSAQSQAKNLGIVDNAADTPQTAPECARHQRPCKLVVVKKNTKGNKGRKFYCCSMPRGEQCDHFQWAEDTAEAARRTLQKNTSHSSFVARQVAAHVNRFKNLTVPELREEATRRQLSKAGKKSELLLRLALWARGEIIKASPDPDDVNDEATESKSASKEAVKEIILEDSDSDDESEMLELTDDKSDASSLEVDHDEETDDEMDSRLSKEPPIHEVPLHESLKTLFGHSKFRDGQEWAVQRCLEGKKSLLVAPTGFGKSLCYSMPAALMDGVCIVVSPLISLIQDQLRALPPRIPAATLSGSISASETAAILDDVERKRIKILFVSPERLTSPSFRRLFNQRWNPETQQRERKFPEISLLCVDEAHCVSQWAHNFRPCFLRFKNLLNRMSPKSILAVTATAGPKVVQDITDTLGMDTSESADDGCVRIIDKPRDNIEVACQYVESHEARLDMISKILMPHRKGSTKSKYAGALANGSVIIYVWRQRDTEVVAENLMSSGVEGGVVIYHGGMDSNARSKAQSKFMRGKARICVATVAFGMGIDKKDIVGIVHLYLSSSPEHYIQEIGRAGRDGRSALAISLPTMEEIPVRHSLVHSTFISKSQIKPLLFAIKESIDNVPLDVEAEALHVALPVEELVLRCDCKSETIETLLSLLEQSGGSGALLHVEGFNYDKATIALKKRSLEKLAEREVVAQCIQRVGKSDDITRNEPDARSSEGGPFQRQFLAYSRGSHTFSVATCANVLGPTAEPRHVFAALRRLQTCGELELALDTTKAGRVFHVTVSQKGLELFRSEDFDARVEDVIDQLHTSFTSSTVSAASKVLDIHYVMHSMSAEKADTTTTPTALSTEKTKSLQVFHDLVHQYFSGGFDKERHELYPTILPENFFQVRRRELENDLFVLVRDLPLLLKEVPETTCTPVFGGSNYADYTATAAAKFLHGLDSPRAPVHSFRNHAMFGKWREVQFATLLESLQSLL